MNKYIPTTKPIIAGSYAEKVKKRAESLEGRQAAMKLAVAEELWTALERAGISQAELARRSGTSPQYITKVFKGTTNFTLESMVALFHHIGHEFEVGARPKAAWANCINYRPAILKPDATQSAGYRPWVADSVREKSDDPNLAA
jgi:transcriptional regulator with XRE-family HTH domain